MALAMDASISLACLYAAHWLYTHPIFLGISSTRPPSSPAPARAYILTNKVTHARLLPPESKHAFTYPTVSLLLSLDALESGSLDLPLSVCGFTVGYLFRFGSRWGTLLGLRGDGYLGGGSDDGAPNTNGKRTSVSIRRKLTRIFLDRSMIHFPSELKDAWMMTMPALCGFEGSNPLTVYFCYRESGEVGWVVLEVHNTFGDGYAYIMEIGKDEDRVPSRGSDHQWTFPRRFFVSPFNDRSGFYTVSVVLPSHPPFSFSSPSVRDSGNAAPPKPCVRVHYHLPAPSSPPPSSVSPPSDPISEPAPGPLKLLAHLTANTSHPLTPHTLLATLARTPLTLFLTLPRILYEAARLHYRRKLRVWRRMDMEVRGDFRVTPLPGSDARENGDGDAQTDGNVAGDGRDGEEIPGTLFTRPASLLERYARYRVCTFLRRRCATLDVRVKLFRGERWAGDGRVLRFGFRDGTGEEEGHSLESQTGDTQAETLTIKYTSPRLFTLLLSSPSSRITLLLRPSTSETSLSEEGDRVPVFEPTNEELFFRVFDSWSDSGSRPPESWIEQTTQRLRLHSVPRGLLSSHPPHAPHFLSSSRIHTHPGALTPLRTRLANHLFALVDLLVVLTLLAQDCLEEKIFSVLGVRPVISVWSSRTLGHEARATGAFKVTPYGCSSGVRELSAAKKMVRSVDGTALGTFNGLMMVQGRRFGSLRRRDSGDELPLG
ncbi:hypothetical protein HYDPIDRAFT_42422 [Hydnomerulius pinastri MD-312]|uniref:DUF1365-domain-containing protein n=1 Tax=Hydnomerulius pinastri MD-312 TaxID=994086 RepID=A0A0C9UXR7_9AGAM|nr:hypothetical protein HYDPIDRAFT_44758 [Hydnomerulius pinastri MD-312]KIJ61710.1 hypothetical protein HYDPIDRAFT_42422 [Hydnomerulius pinastri MD-312]